MNWDNVLTLLKVADMTRAYGQQLKALHDAAMAVLTAIDPNDLPTGNQDNLEPLGDAEE